MFAPVTYIEPFSASNRHSLGFDLFSVPETRSAMEKACDTSDAALTGRPRLPLADTEGKKRNGALMFILVYRKDAPKETFDERSQALIGWTFGPLLQDDLINGILEPWDQQEGATLDLEIRDGLDRASATPLFDGKTGHTASADSAFLPVAHHRFQRPPVAARIRPDDHGRRRLRAGVAGAGRRTGTQRPAVRPAAVHSEYLHPRAADRRATHARDSRTRIRTAEKRGEASTVLDNVESLIYLKDTKGRYLFANKRALELYGTTEEQLISKPGDEQFFDEDAVARI